MGWELELETAEVPGAQRVNESRHGGFGAEVKKLFKNTKWGRILNVEESVGWDGVKAEEINRWQRKRAGAAACK